MEESQNAEEDLLAFLQPLTMPDEFTFEARTRHFEDSSEDDADQEPIPGPAPPAPVAPEAPMAPMAPMAPVAPMAPMDPIETIDPVAAVAPETSMIEPNGVASFPPPETNGHKEDQAVIEQDDDAIEYETPKSTRKSPAKRSIRSRATPKSRRDDCDDSPHDSAAELLRRFATPSAKKRVEAKPDPESDPGAKSGSPVKTVTRKARKTTGESAGFEAESSPDPWKFEVVIKPLPPAAAEEYTKVPPGDEIYRVLNVIKTDVPGEAWLSVEFEDGRVDQVSHSYRTGSLQLKHTLARLTPFYSLPRNEPFGKEASGKFSLPACLLGTSLPSSSLQQYRFPVPFHDFPQQAPTNCDPPIPSCPATTLHPSPKHQTSSRAQAGDSGFLISRCLSTTLHCPATTCTVRLPLPFQLAQRISTGLQLLSSGTGMRTRPSSTSSQALTHSTSLLTKLMSLCNLHLNSRIWQ